MEYHHLLSGNDEQFISTSIQRTPHMGLPENGLYTRNIAVFGGKIMLDH